MKRTCKPTAVRVASRVAYGGALFAVFLSMSVTYAKAVTVRQEQGDFAVYPFGGGGQLKMIYDRRQRPQAVFLNDMVYIVYNGGAPLDAVEREDTYPFVVTFDPAAGTLSSPIQLSPRGSGDQHYCPIIWADSREFLHVLYGCHKTPGTHLISKQPAEIGQSAGDWSKEPEVRNSLSYPTVHMIYDGKKLIYFRTGEHRSSWSYLISDDEGRTWSGPEHDVTDLNMGEETTVVDHADMNEMSSYHTTVPSRDGKYLHVAFCSYDDNKKNLRDKFWNPRYKTKKNLGFKYNLYYVRINLQTHEVTNFDGETVRTPIDIDTANAKCMIWDTDWRGASVPPDIIVDDHDHPAFMHVLSEDTADTYNYYYVRYVIDGWKQTVIAPSNHGWNSCYLRADEQGALYAYPIVGSDAPQSAAGKMDSKGGGNIEEWRSVDKGDTWEKIRDLTPKDPEFSGWKFNNIQPVKDPEGHAKEGMFLFYGWGDNHLCKGKAFLIVD